MNAMQEQLFGELRQTQTELIQSLKNRQKDDFISVLMEEELADIKAAIEKLEAGNFGKCEISGDQLPENILKIMPTLKSAKDTEYIESFYRKSINSSFF